MMYVDVECLQLSEGVNMQMQQADFEFFKNLLLSQRADILNKAELFKEESLIENNQGDEGDLASSEFSMSMHLRLQERHAHLLQKVDYALAKIENGSFGVCESCEEPLNMNRLKARPVANLCIACKEEQENKERAFA